MLEELYFLKRELYKGNLLEKWPKQLWPKWLRIWRKVANKMLAVKQQSFTSPASMIS